MSTNTRYPKGLHDALQQLAREHKRSFNAEVMWALERYIGQEKTEQMEGERTRASWGSEEVN